MDQMLRDTQQCQQTASQALSVASLSSLNEYYSKRTKNSAFAEGMVEDERTHLFYEETLYQQRPDLRDANVNRVKDAAAVMRVTNLPVPNGRHLGLHKYPEASDALPLERFLVVSPSNEQFGLLAKAHMAENGIEYGDMLQIEKRTQGLQWLEETQKDFAGGQASMQVTELKQEVRRPRVSKPKKMKKRYQF